MAQPSWNKTLGEVLQHNTKTKIKKSENTGNDYTVEYVPKLEVVSTGSVEEVNGGYRYPIVDTVHQLEYVIKAPNKLDVTFGSKLVFTEVTGNSNKGRPWYKAESVALSN